MKLKEATVTNGDAVYYKPEWGPFDLILGSTVVSVYSGPADRKAYGQNDDFVVKKVAQKKPTSTDLKIYRIYRDISHLRTKFDFKSPALPTLKSFYADLKELDSRDWLAVLEIYELLMTKKEFISKETGYEDFVKQIRQDLESKKSVSADNADSIDQGINLAQVP